MDPLLKSLCRTLQKYEMVRPGERVLVGVSGGPDSVALLYGLLRAGPSLQLQILYIHHGLRGAEADREAKWVEALGARLGLPYTERRIEPGSLVTPGLSLQMAARRRRYEIFREEVRRQGAHRLALGHTADDRAETLLMGLLRGVGLKGLSGIPPMREGWIIRPLLETPRKLIEAYLSAEGIPFLQDPSNLRQDFLRNRIRHRLLPELESSYNPRLRETLSRTAELLWAEDAWMEAETARALDRLLVRWPKGELVLPVSALGETHLALRRRLLLKVLTDLGAPTARLRSVHIEALLESLCRWEGERRFRLPGGLSAVRQRDWLIFYRRDEAPRPLAEVPLQIPGRTALEPWGLTLSAQVLARGEAGPFQGNPLRAWFDFEKVGGELLVRSRRPGDRFRPLGLQGTKKLKDFFIDAGIPRRERDGVPLLVAGGEILWVIGHRLGKGAEVSEKTETILALEAEGRAGV